MTSGTGADDVLCQGRPLRAWAESLRGADDAAGQQAGEALVQAGTALAAALPALAAALKHRSGAARAETAAEMGRIGVQLLAVIPRFRDALQAIVLTDGDEEVRTNCLNALTLIGPVSISQVPALVESLRNTIPDIRAAAAQDLAQLGAEARETVTVLTTACLHDPDLAVRVHAGAALWRVGRRLLPALPALVQGLRSGDPLLCWTAADCLGDMGSEAADAVPALLEAHAKQPRPLIRTSIALALERIDPKAAATVV